MQEGDHIGKVSLVITDKKYILPGQTGNMLSAPYTQFINDNQSGPGNYAYDCI